jgi:hypothetical protein
VHDNGPRLETISAGEAHFRMLPLTDAVLDLIDRFT